MKSIFLVKNGDSSSAFEVRESPKPVCGSGQILVKTRGFGLNYADVMARLGLYKDAPPIPAVLGYDVCGVVEQVGEGVTHVKPGDSVTAMTRFGGYAEYALTLAPATVKIPENMRSDVSTALATQYCTAWHAACEMVQLMPGDKVLISAAAGGVGTALIQIALSKGCKVIAVVGNDQKGELVKSLGAADWYNYRKGDVHAEVLNAHGRMDVIFDSVGGSNVSKGFQLLKYGGKMVCYGAAQMSSQRNIFSKIRFGLAFGFYHPAQFMMNSKSFIGVNMLRLADHRPQAVQRALEGVMELYHAGKINPVEGKIFKAAQIAEAHDYLASGQSVGKIAVEW